MTTAGLILALAGPADLPAVVALMATAFDPRFGEAWTGGQLTGALSVPDTWVQAAWDRGALAGFTLVRRILDEAELMLVAVDPVRRRSGLGRVLIDGATATARSRGARSMFLEVRDGNCGATALYRASGFTEIGRRRDYYTGKNGDRFDAITLRRALT